MSRASATLTPALVGLALVAAACEQEMRDDGRLKPLEPQGAYPGGVVHRELPRGVIPRGDDRLDVHLGRGRDEAGLQVTTYPFPITAADLRRGAERYGIHCEPCHGRLGEGDGMAVRRGYPAPPPYTYPRIVGDSPGKIFAVITEGLGIMPDYDHIPLDDRWRITAWVQVLQFSQRAPLGRLRPDERARLREGR